MAAAVRADPSFIFLPCSAHSPFQTADLLRDGWPSPGHPRAPGPVPRAPDDLLLLPLGLALQKSGPRFPHGSVRSNFLAYGVL